VQCQKSHRPGGLISRKDWSVEPSHAWVGWRTAKWMYFVCEQQQAGTSVCLLLTHRKDVAYKPHASRSLYVVSDHYEET
jgi:hypothetical protein